MHRATSVLTWGAAGLIGLAIAAPAAAQQPPEQVPMPQPADAPARAKNAVVLAIDGTKRLSMSTKRPIRSATTDKETIARVQPMPDEINAVLVVGLQAGTTTLRLTD